MRTTMKMLKGAPSRISSVLSPHGTSAETGTFRVEANWEVSPSSSRSASSPAALSFFLRSAAASSWKMLDTVLFFMPRSTWPSRKEKGGVISRAR